MITADEFDMQTFLAERDAALLSLDRDEILAYAAKYDAEAFLALAGSDKLFWIAVHKARTGCLSLPDEAREASRRWLARRGYKPMG